MSFLHLRSLFFFFNDTATTEIYTLSLHDALPICLPPTPVRPHIYPDRTRSKGVRSGSVLQQQFPCQATRSRERSEEHTSELQSRLHLVCRLLLEKKKNHSSSMDSTEVTV